MTSKQKRPPQNFKEAFERCLLDRTGIVMNNGPCNLQDMYRDLEVTKRLGGFAGDDLPGNEALKEAAADRAAANIKEWSEDLQGPDGLLTMTEKLGPLNKNLASESHLKPFFKHLCLPQLSVTVLDDDACKFTNLAFLDVSRNSLTAIDNLPPQLKFLKAYNNKIQSVTCRKMPSLVFLGLGYNALSTEAVEQLSLRFRSLLSLDIAYNNITNIRQSVAQDIAALDKLKHLSIAGNPITLLPYYRLVLARYLPQLQLLDEQSMGEAELADAQLAEDRHLTWPEQMNLSISFSQVEFVDRLLTPLALELPETKPPAEEGGEPVPVSEADRLKEVCEAGTFLLSFELPSGEWVETTAIEIKEEEKEEVVDPKAKAKATPSPVEDKPVCPEVLNLSSLSRSSDAELVSQDAEAAPCPLFFKMSLPAEVASIRDWLQIGLRIKAFYKKKPEPPPEETEAEVAEGEEPPEPPAPPEPPVARPIGGGLAVVSSNLWPHVQLLSDELRDGQSLPVPPVPWSMNPATVSLAPFSKWFEPDVQVPEAAAAKSLSDESARLSMDIVLWAEEPVLPEEGEVAEA